VCRKGSHDEKMFAEVSSSPLIVASSWGLLIGTIKCPQCFNDSPTGAAHFSAFEQFEESGPATSGGAGLLHFVEMISPEARLQLRSRAPWMKEVWDSVTGRTFLTHHCSCCGAIIPDYEVFSERGPYRKWGPGVLGALVKIPANGGLTARGCVLAAVRR
jgi:hypothetical protein